MVQLRDIYKDLEKKSTGEIMALINTALSEILPELKKYDADIAKLFAGYVFTVVAADGKIRDEEMIIVKPIIDAIWGISSTKADAKEIILKNGFKDKDMREGFRGVLDAIGRNNPDLRIRMILLAMYISAIDGDISRKEKAFIESLI